MENWSMLFCHNQIKSTSFVNCVTGVVTGGSRQAAQRLALAAGTTE